MNLPLQLSVHTECWKYAKPFRIAGRCYTDKAFVVVELAAANVCGRGEEKKVDRHLEKRNQYRNG